MRLSVAVIILLFVGGCSSGSFLGKRFDNFTAYYNTFYNARKSFDAASKTVKTGDAKIDRDVYLNVIDVGGGGSGAREFENTIKKSADVLRKHPQSKWVDDALLLIGKSYYYTANTVGAEQKFREVIDRESSLEDEARFWLGLTLIASGAYDQAGEHLRESISREQVNRKWRSKMQVALGELYVRQELWPEAAEALRDGTADIKDDELGARAAFLLGQVYETLREFGLAAEAYRKVRKFNPTYELAFASRYNATRVEGLHGDVDEALKEVRRMERDGKNFADRAELAYLRGRILESAEYMPDAVDVYYDILYDSDANITAVRGPVHYRLATVYRDYFLDFTLAAAHFDTASTVLKGVATRNQALSSRATQSRPAPGAITDVADQAEIFGTYAALWGRVARFDSLLHLGSLDDEAFAAKIKEIRRQTAEELIERRREEKQRFVEAGFDRAGAVQEGPAATPVTQQAIDPTSTAGFLFHRDRSRVQEGLISFFDRWGERPLVPNWRRRAAIAGQAEAASEGTGEQSAASSTALPIDASLSADALAASVEVDVSAVPRTDEARAAMRGDRAAARYELANVLFLSVQLPDSAAAWYRRVVEEDAETNVAARALYALAEVQLSLGDRESAEAIYRQVAAEYPETDVAERAAERAGMPAPIDGTDDDRESGAEEYRDAYAMWSERQYVQATESMLEIAANYLEFDVGARALLAAAAIYLEWADSTNTDPLDPISLDVDPMFWRTLGLLGPIEDSTQDSVSAAERAHIQRVDTLNTQPGPTATATAGDSLSVQPEVTASPGDSLSVQPGATPSPGDSLSVQPGAAPSPGDSLSVQPGAAPLAADALSVPTTGPDSLFAQPTATASPTDSVSTQPTASPLDTRATPNTRISRVDTLASPTNTTSVAEDARSVPRSVPGSNEAAHDRSGHSSVDAPDTALVLGDPDESFVNAPAQIPEDAVVADTIAQHVGPAPQVRLEDLYDVIVDRYPGSEYAKRASALREALMQLRKEREDALAELEEPERASPQADAPPDQRPETTPDRTEPDVGAAIPVETPKLRRALADEKEGETAIEAGKRGRLLDEAGDTTSVAATPQPRSPVDAAATEVDSEPVPVGGPGAIQRMIRYPEMAREAGVTGEVLVTFVVDIRGQVNDARVVKGLGYGCDQEALRVISRTRYRPAMKDGRAVVHRMEAALAFGASASSTASE